MSAIIDYRGKTPPKSDRGTWLVTAKVVKNGFIAEEPKEYIPSEDYDTWMRRGLPEIGDVLVTTEAPMGQVAAIRSTAEIALAQRLILLRADSTVLDQDFLLYSMQTPAVQNQLRARATGTTVLGIKQSELRKVLLPAPALRIQQSVGRALRAFDDLIENNRRRIEILEEMARLLYREWFVHFRFPGHAAVELVDSELGPIPEGWDARTLGEVAENFDRKRVPLSKMQRAKKQGSYPYYGAAKIFDYVDDFIFDGEYLLLGEDGTVVDGVGGPLLQLVKGKFWCNNHAHVLKGTAASTRRLWCALHAYPIAGHVTGAAQPKITQANMNRIPIVVPDAETSKKFDEAVDPMIDLWFNLERQNGVLREARDLLLPRLVSGELDVSDLDLDGALV